jgi:hypothetical protein
MAYFIKYVALELLGTCKFCFKQLKLQENSSSNFKRYCASFS